jgi:CheY-like chemotaxis protein
MNTVKPILLVEDDKIDYMTVKRAIKELKVTNKLIWAENGEEAINYLKDENNAMPGIILLDINMPKMNGIEFLKIAKKDEKLKLIPIVVITTSKDEYDKIQSFDLGVAGYMEKPVDYKQFVEVVRTINLYWTLSEFP